MLNKVFLQGRLVADPELRHTPNGVAAASFRLAVERDFKDKETGERKADFVSVVAWRQTGIFVSKYFTKGQMAVVEGKLQSRTYEDRDGNRRYTMDVVADNVYFADSAKREGDGSGRPPAATGGNNDSYYPTAPGPDQFADLTEDDGELPF